MKYILLLFPFFLFSKPFKVATYNVENLFDTTFQGTEYKEYIPHTHNWNRRTKETKLNHIAEVICDVDADIFGLQEIENSHIFTELMDRLKEVGCGYEYGVITSKKDTAIQVALLSRYPISKHHDIFVNGKKGVRAILEATVEVQNKDLILFVNHWKSKAYEGLESKRIAYAKALQSRLSKLSSSQEYILLGDFNSDYNAYLTLENKLNDTQGYTGFNDVLKTKIGTKLVDETLIQSNKDMHYTLWHEIKSEYRWSHKFYGKKSSLDHIVLPHNMFDNKGINYINDSFKVFKEKYLFTKKGYINRWKYKKGKHKAKGYSDHLPIYAYFDTKPYYPNMDTMHVYNIIEKSIDYLYSKDSFSNQIKLKDVIVVLKRGNNAIIKQAKSKRGIYLYGCARDLKEGHSYDLFVENIKNYHGLKEIGNAYKLEDKGLVPLANYYASIDEFLKNPLKHNEVVKEVIGKYSNKMLEFEGKKFPIYFKQKKSTPPNGSKLKIHYAHVGYYKRQQLVVYSKKDFQIVE